MPIVRTAADEARVPQFTIYYASKNEIWEHKSTTNGFPWDAGRRQVQTINWTPGVNQTVRLSGNDYYVYDVDDGSFVGSDVENIRQRREEDENIIVFSGREVTAPQYIAANQRALDDRNYYGFLKDPQTMLLYLETVILTEDYRKIEEARIEGVRDGYRLIEDIDPICKEAMFYALAKNLGIQVSGEPNDPGGSLGTPTPNPGTPNPGGT